MEIEQRIYVAEVGIETRSAEEGGGIDFLGEGIVFGKPSRLMFDKARGPFVEIIVAGALDGADMSEVLAVFNHDENQLLGANYSGTLRFDITPQSVLVRIRKPDNTVGINCAEWVRRGDIRGMSFKFTTLKDRWERIGGVLHRFVEKIGRLLDLSLVTRAAYLQTSVSVDVAMRSYDAWTLTENQSVSTEERSAETPEATTEIPEGANETPEVREVTDESVSINSDKNEPDVRGVADDLAWYKAVNRTHAHRNSLQLQLCQ